MTEGSCLDLYLGNCYPMEGEIDAYRELKDRGSELVISREEKVKKLAITLNFDIRKRIYD